MQSISDEIRHFVERSYKDEHMDPRELLALADRIGAEMVELPKDRDGVPIHVGDTVWEMLGDGEEETVRSITLTGGTAAVTTSCNGFRAGVRPNDLTHTAPDSWERIANELEKLSESNRINGSGEVFYRAGELAARIRRLADKEG